MSVVSESLRQEVVARAGNRCEYCHAPAEGQIGRFPIDHVIPRTDGGPTDLANLAMACPHCNGHKWAHADGIDPTTNESVPLFNPRAHNWAEHFQWSVAVHGAVEGKTGCGRATIARLEMNHPDMVAVRRLLATLGLFRELPG